ncbi:hypothetical protein [Actinoallomurus sp. CA-150999]|uniref:hypothetical protein n=1 Tax=Actinoallomurus sp. CA-150999 TaxID=3239887 RepID=UPI003D9504F7
MRTSARLHTELTAIIDRAYDATDRADGPMIRALLGDLAGTGLDQRTAAFLSQAHQLALDTTAALTSVLDTHRFGSCCSECGTSDPCRTIRGISEIFIPSSDASHSRA